MQNKQVPAPSVTIRKATWLPAAVGEPGPDFLQDPTEEPVAKSERPPIMPTEADLPIEPTSSVVGPEAATSEHEETLPTAAPDATRVRHSDAATKKVKPASAPSAQTPDTAEAAATATDSNEQTAPSATEPPRKSEIEVAVHAALQRKTSSLPGPTAPPAGTWNAPKTADRRSRPTGTRASRPKGSAFGGVAIVVCAVIAAAAFLVMSHEIDISWSTPATNDLPENPGGTSTSHAPSPATTPSHTRSRARSTQHPQEHALAATGAWSHG
ncbi:hypothetical protein [Actinacidiphila glaucinigra]|uniref:hypothetical protein n=1 Tax=Actinacidiphila glaucinigra TaxID=235986 RepID=UPI003D93850E